MKILKATSWYSILPLALVAACGGGSDSKPLCPAGCPAGYVCSVQGLCVPNMPLAQVDGGKDVGSATEPVVDAVSPSVIPDTLPGLVADSMVTIDHSDGAAVTDAILATGGVFATGGTLATGGSIATGGTVIPSQDSGIIATGGSVVPVDASPDLVVVVPPDTAIVIADTAVAAPDAPRLCTPNKATGNYPIIDNMADGDNAILSQDGRAGWWVTFNDGTGTQMPTAPDVVASKGKICTSGFGFTSWGAGLVTALNTDGTNHCTYDASVYQGITLSLEGVVAGRLAMRFTIPTADISKASDLSGGSCVDSPTDGSCNDFFGISLVGSTAGVVCNTSLTSWVCGPATGAAGPIAVTIPFAKMTQAGWIGSKVFPRFDITKMLSLQWNFFGSSTTTSNFNFCVSNISFY